MSNYLRALPAYKRELQLKELEAASEAKVDVLVTVYHADHRELCAHERDWPFKIIDAPDLVRTSLGSATRTISSASNSESMQILADCADLDKPHGLDQTTARLSLQERSH